VQSDYAFQLLGLGWEWGLVAASLIIYLAATEAWKAVRRMSSKNKDRGGPTMTEKNLPRFDTIAEREKGV
jgi:Na+-exporting ATPase